MIKSISFSQHEFGSKRLPLSYNNANNSYKALEFLDSMNFCISDEKMAVNKSAD